MGTYEWWKRKNKDGKNQWSWRFRSSNGKIIARSSESYSSKKACVTSIELVMAAGKRTKVEEVKA